MLHLVCLLSAYTAPLASRPVVAGRAPAATMQLTKKIISFDQDGVFEGREVSLNKPQVRLLERVEELQLLTTISEAGLLSGAESAGVFSKLEKAKAFSTIEGLLPLADKLKLLSLAESLLNVPAALLFGAGVFLLIGEAGLIAFVPDDNTGLVALQAVTGLAAGAGAVTLWGTSFFFSLLQGDN